MVKARVNERIIATKVRLILSNGDNLGEISKITAMEMARKDGLDLVEVSQGTVPVCRIMDYGKMVYQKQKSEKHKQHAPAMKEVRIKYNTGVGDLTRQQKKAKDFLTEGHKVLFVMIVKGRERYVNHGLAKEKFVSIVNEVSSSIKPNDIIENDRGYNVTIHPQG